MTTDNSAGPARTDENARPTPPPLGAVGMLRWAWRQLTSMRTALFLLLLLAIAAVPGSLFPQRPANPALVTQYIKNRPDYGPALDALQLFDVYSSAWFSAIYILLFISLIGCVVPRARAHYKAMRSHPPRTPKRLSRLPEYGTLQVPAEAGIPAAAAIAGAAAALKKRGYRVQVRDEKEALPSLGAERGFLKEAGNLVFHTSLIGVLICLAIGGLFGFRGQKILIEGDTFVNTLVGYDNFAPGTNFQSSWLEPFTITLDTFAVRFDRESSRQFGQPIDFNAQLRTRDAPGAAQEPRTLKVNDPVYFGEVGVFLVGNGYAPVITVRDGNGDTAFSGPVVAIPNDGVYTSTVVIKVPDARPAQLGFVGFLLPSAIKNDEGVAYSFDPDPLNPQLNLNSYYGDLGLDTGVPQNVYNLDVKGLTQLNGRELPAKGITLAPGGTYTLPEGKGSISFDGLKRYIGVDIRSTPGQTGVLIFSLMAVAGLLASLYVNRRRVWVRAGTHEDGRTMVEYGLLARGEDHRLTAEAAAIRALLVGQWQLQEDPGGV
ncbi:cytochrome c biogenesis protein ResB (plasmid) [Arthrobacter sp. TES]|uniref:cytochrome c biogenesis protein ResB n=1 Tax=Paenarthrobacter ureafaciens TaxID=37931 RepID=UPI000397C906|nr:cytochrome C biogenesis protein ResB [Arthrobacter sp. ZXY-2]ERI38076.1 cytochrome C biogenesis protein ResB [Arthrobacter sp. AK-YN10]QOI65733.1 cytochrome c biogenesis protein ResB [Arthrobacter sp. TES]GLU60881.1 cytochrome c biogenesis protein ResB [Paenarthrobacter ureafaciens]GLU65151.1 cytochrome c biogenesis protein ResB [Paenarthrobacter ureafaciens]